MQLFHIHLFSHSNLRPHRHRPRVVLNDSLVDFDQSGTEERGIGNTLGAGEVCSDSNGRDGQIIQQVLSEGEVGLERDDGTVDLNVLESLADGQVLRVDELKIEVCVGPVVARPVGCTFGPGLVASAGAEESGEVDVGALEETGDIEGEVKQLVLGFDMG